MRPKIVLSVLVAACLTLSLAFWARHRGYNSQQKDALLIPVQTNTATFRAKKVNPQQILPVKTPSGAKTGEAKLTIELDLNTLVKVPAVTNTVKTN